jgi:hypothetical protein
MFQILASKLLYLKSGLTHRGSDVEETQVITFYPCNPSHSHSFWNDPLEHGSQICERGAFHSLQASPMEQLLSFPFHRFL